MSTSLCCLDFRMRHSCVKPWRRLQSAQEAARTHHHHKTTNNHHEPHRGHVQPFKKKAIVLNLPYGGRRESEEEGEGYIAGRTNAIRAGWDVSLHNGKMMEWIRAEGSLRCFFKDLEMEIHPWNRAESGALLPESMKQRVWSGPDTEHIHVLPRTKPQFEIFPGGL